MRFDNTIAAPSPLVKSINIDYLITNHTENLLETKKKPTARKEEKKHKHRKMKREGEKKRKTQRH